ncbi:MAG TPA: type IV pilin protein [Aquabacterium sp.]|nr:type IV pilin protein [Aquabacterium sp.]HQC95997.1 type IV pilin protein [Aquabacterium sp.]
MDRIRTPQRGFTLVELMIVVAIAALLLGLALPSYNDSVRRGRRSDAADVVTGVMHAQERWRGLNPRYSDNLAALNQPTQSLGGYYSLALSAVSGAGYTLTATAVSGRSQASDSGCTTLTVTVANGNPTYAPAACWGRG